MGKRTIRSVYLSDGDIYVNEYDEEFVVSESKIHRNVGVRNETLITMRLTRRDADGSSGFRDAWSADRMVHIIDVPEIYRPSVR